MINDFLNEIEAVFIVKYFTGLKCGFIIILFVFILCLIRILRTKIINITNSDSQAETDTVLGRKGK